MIDAEISQMAYMLDVIKIVDIDVLHEPSPVPKVRFENAINDVRDFHHETWRNQRMKDCATLATYMHSIDPDTTEFFRNVLEGRQDPWEKLVANDINKQQIQFPIETKTGTQS
jgi:hypothetical protein